MDEYDESHHTSVLEVICGKRIPLYSALKDTVRMVTAFKILFAIFVALFPQKAESDRIQTFLDWIEQVDELSELVDDGIVDDRLLPDGINLRARQVNALSWYDKFSLLNGGLLEHLQASNENANKLEAILRRAFHIEVVSRSMIRTICEFTLNAFRLTILVPDELSMEGKFKFIVREMKYFCIWKYPDEVEDVELIKAAIELPDENFLILPDQARLYYDGSE